MPYPPERVIPRALADAVAELGTWFVIGGQAVRCLLPYRPSRDVDFGVADARGLADLLAALRRSGRTEVLERHAHTVHLRWEGIDVSIFVLPRLSRHVEERRLDVEALLATKLHAVLDRGTRRDFFDLYVLLQENRLALVQCFTSLRRVYETEIDEALLLRALTYFDDAEREARLPGEGKRDWAAVKDFFLTRVGQLLAPPGGRLAIQAEVVDLIPERRPRRPKPRR